MAPSRGRGSSNKTQAKSSNGSRRPKNTNASSSSSPSVSKLSSVASSTASEPSDRIAPSAALLQSLLCTFTSAFPALLEPNAAANVLPNVLQQVKHFLYERDFAKAFGRPDFLEAYAARWSASRAAGYCEIFQEAVDRHVDGVQDDATLRVLCLGGGSGAELVGLAGMHQLINKSLNLQVVTADVADWSKVLTALCSSLTSSPSIIEPAHLTHTFQQQDLLSADASAATQKHVADSQLITMMFTLNELFSASLSKTQALLLDITAAATPGTLLLVVDSPGSYSTVQLGGKEKQYPMAWMMDHVLLKIASELEQDSAEEEKAGNAEEGGTKSKEETSGKEVQGLGRKVGELRISDSDGKKAEKSPKWEKLVHEPSRWYRLPKTLEYPIELEDMRVQMYLYRRC